MTDLAQFLLARIAEDEAVAHAVRPDEYLTTREVSRLSSGNRGTYTCVSFSSGRVLAECKAKREIVALSGWTGPKAGLRDRLFGPAADEAFQQGVKAAMRAVALPYADHPDYRQEWRP